MVVNIKCTILHNAFFPQNIFDVCDVNIFAIIAQVYFSIFAKIIIFNVALHKKQMTKMTSI